MANVFISYSKKDVAITQTLAQAFVAQGYSVWYDANISSGDNFREEIGRELELAASVVVIWTPSSSSSDWVISEAQRAYRLGKLVPVRTQELAPEAIPQPFDVLHTALVASRAEIFKAVDKKISNRRLVDSASLTQSSISSQGSGPALGFAGAEARSTSSLTAPSRCFGRYSDVSALVDALVKSIRVRASTKQGGFASWFRRGAARSLPRPAASRIIVFGGPGMGKTTLTRAVACHDLVVANFEERRFFVPLESVTSRMDFCEAFRRALGVPATPAGGLISLAKCLDTLSGKKAVIVVDNLETALEVAGRDIEDELGAFETHPNVAVIASIRGRTLPAVPRWTVRHEIKPLDTANAQALFSDIAPNIASTDPHYGPLIEQLGGVPLAIELVAHEASTFTSLEVLWAEWERIGTAVARRSDADADRLSSFDHSLEVSLNSPNRLPNSLMLLSIVAASDGGADVAVCERIFGPQHFALIRDLLGAGLVYQTEHRIDMLPPIREYALRTLGYDQDHWRALVGYYLDRAEWFAQNGDPKEESTIRRFLLTEQRNFSIWLGDAFHTIPIRRLHYSISGVLTFLKRVGSVEGVRQTIISFHRLLQALYVYHALMAFKRKLYVVAVSYFSCSLWYERIVVRTMQRNFVEFFAELEAIAADANVHDRRLIRKLLRDTKEEYDSIVTALDAPDNESLRRYSQKMFETEKAVIDDMDTSEFILDGMRSPEGLEPVHLEAMMAQFVGTARFKLEELGFQDYYVEMISSGVDASTWVALPNEIMSIRDHTELFFDVISSLSTTNPTESKLGSASLGLDADGEVSLAEDLAAGIFIDADIRSNAKAWIEAAAELGNVRARYALADLPLGISIREAEAANQHEKAFGLWAELAVRVENQEIERTGRAQIETASALMSSSWQALMAREYAEALIRSQRAESLDPDGLFANTAHALMFLDRTPEARAIYRKHIGRTLPGGVAWEDAISKDFTEMRKAGLMTPLMSEMERELNQRSSPAVIEAKPGFQYSEAVLRLKRDIYRFVRAMEEGRDGEARTELAGAARRHPKCARFIAQSLIARGEAALTDSLEADQLSKARKLFLEASSWGRREQVDQALLARALFGLGQVYYSQQHYSEAVGAFREALELGRTDAENWLWWATNWLGSQEVQHGNAVEGLLVTWTNLLDRKHAIDLRDLKENDAPWVGLGHLHGTLHSAGRVAKPTDCDVLASCPYDPHRVAPGVTLESINVPAAVVACNHAVASDPQQPRFRYQRARVHVRAGEVAKAAGDEDVAATSFKGALADCQVAIASGYPAAVIAMARMVRAGEGVQEDAERAADLSLEGLNRTIRGCAIPVVRHLLAEERKHNVADVRRVVRALLSWSAALGNAEARAVIDELVAKGTLATTEVPSAATLTDLPPWLTSSPPSP